MWPQLTANPSSQYIFPVLEGVSIFCLAHQDSLVFTNLFGGASGNEGTGLCNVPGLVQFLKTDSEISVHLVRLELHRSVWITFMATARHLNKRIHWLYRMYWAFHGYLLYQYVQV